MPGNLELHIRCPEGQPRAFDIAPGIYSIGSDEDCKICLAHPKVDGRHAILTVRDSEFWIEDLQARGGTRLDADVVVGRREVRVGQDIGIGPFLLSLRRRAEQPPARVAPPSPAPAGADAAAASALPGARAPAPAPPAAPAPAAVSPDRWRDVKTQIHRELVARLDIKRMAAAHVDREQLEKQALDTIRAIVREVAGRLPPGASPEQLIKEVRDEALGLGPLQDFLDDPEITEVMVNGPSQIYVERNGRLVRTDKTFMDDSSVLTVIERIVSPIGRRIDESQPYVDARLPDGSRVNAIIHPLSLVGPCLTIRKFSKTPFTDKDMVRLGTMTPQMADFARLCVLMRKNIVVSGGTGSGKTTLLNVLSAYLPESERIVTIEDAAELRLGQSHVVRLEARPPNIEGRGEVTIRDLVRNALRMRPDRIVVGECRGGEALDMLQAMNTGHDGSLTTIHANSPRDVISRLETMVLMSGMDLPVRAIREQIASAIDLIVHEARFSDGTRKISRVTEVVGLEGDRITMQDIFEFRQAGIGEGGAVLGRFVPTGAVPTFIEDIAVRGLSVDRRMFDPQSAAEEA
ncbi:MAG: FHA domain-containing protein [Lentisphaerae bacterium]|nr:FHA domain-containing protein [Lentisphaerota bacterium]